LAADPDARPGRVGEVVIEGYHTGFNI